MWCCFYLNVFIIIIIIIKRDRKKRIKNSLTKNIISLSKDPRTTLFIYLYFNNSNTYFCIRFNKEVGDLKGNNQYETINT